MVRIIFRISDGANMGIFSRGTCAVILRNSAVGEDFAEVCPEALAEAGYEIREVEE